MKFKNITILGDPMLANELGKKGTSSDITFYNYREGDNILSFVEPTEFPDKIQTLIYSINLADAALLKIDHLSRTLGEIIIALDLAKIDKGFIVLGENLIKEQVVPIIKGSVLKNYEFIENDRIKILETLKNADIKPKEGNVRVPIDHFFDVQSVGTVILGTTRGRVNKFDEFVVYPTDKKVTVKSIQIYDEDKNFAESGSRAGLNLRGIKVTELERGYVLAKENTMNVSREIEVKFKVQNFWNYPVEEGNEYVFICGLQQLRAKIKEGSLSRGEEGILKISLDWKLAYEKGDRIWLLRADLPENRIVGSGIII
ncbi:MAG: EF-Tu/IF-2/RF-3 family GTPase [Candidatus Altarchaeaceae archaeon]